MSGPRISVVMSVCNGLAYLPEALRSVLDQSFRDFEFLITDDGSTDGSSACLEAFARQDARIRVLRQENAGLTVSLNRMIALARGEFIARMDADDVSLPSRFARQLSYLERRPRCAVVGTGYAIMDEGGYPVGGTQPLDRSDRLRAWLVSASGNPLCHGSTMIRQAALEGLDPVYRWRYSQDFDLWLRLLERWEVGVVEEVLYRYREHATSVGAKKDLVPLRLAQRRVLADLRRRGLLFDHAACRREIDAIFQQPAPMTNRPSAADRRLPALFFRGDFRGLAAECRRLRDAGQHSRRLSAWGALAHLPVGLGHLGYDLAVRLLNVNASVQRRLLVREVVRVS